ncbi:MAG: BatA and WFA domain-containing protein [Candidatus Omnitrophica bacterium]|nr:BatA and WFA domain-containing protein [Candidatus Omnitrophota bacterium]
MNFLAPFGFFFALFLPAVIILYLLKLKRIDQPISSTLLWRKSLEDLKANTPFQKLKRNLLLFLQLLIIALMTFAIVRPVLRLGGLQGQSFIVMIDASASMSAVDVKPSRLEAAKRKAIELVDDMSMGDRMMVLSFSANARVLTSFEQSKAVLKRSIRDISPTDAGTHIQDALRIARSASDVAVNPEIIVLSDGQFVIPSDISLGGGEFRFVPVGESAENVGIIDLVVRKDFTMEERYEILVGIKNTGLQEQEAYVELWGEGEAAPALVSSPTENTDVEPARALLDARRITMAAGASETILFKDPGNFPEKIEVVLDSGDVLEADNHAWAIVPQEKAIDVLLVSNGNYYLQRVLNLHPRVRLFTSTPLQYARPEEYDIVVFDSFSPPALIGGNYVFINAVPPLSDWSYGEALQFPVIVDWNQSHPLNRYLNYENLVISQCNNIGTPSWVDVILESRETPLIVTFQQEEIRGVVTNFDVYKSTWPRQVSFPIFFTNLINWFQSSEGFAQFMKRTGDVLVIDPPEDLTLTAQLIPPEPAGAQEIAFSGVNPVYFNQTTHRGIYEYRVGDQRRKRYAVNLLSPEESAILPKTSLTFPNTEIEGDEDAVEANREIWRTLTAAALLVLLLEWWIYIKRARYSF